MRLKFETIFEAYDSNMELFGIVRMVRKIWFLCFNHSTYKFYQKNEINLRFFHFHLIKELARKHTKRPDQSKSQVIAKQVVNEEIPWLLEACETNTFFPWVAVVGSDLWISLNAVLWREGPKSMIPFDDQFAVIVFSV